MKLNLKLNFKQASLVALAFSMVGVQAASADAEALFSQAKGYFEQREDLAKNDLAISTCESALAESSDDDELTFDILILQSRAYYFKGNKAANDQLKKEIFLKGMEKADAARKLIDDFAEGHYFYAINLGRWAEANGILESLFKKDELIKAAETAQTRETRTGAKGRTVDGYGPSRTLGRVYHKLPFFAGGSHDLSVKYLSEAYTQTPTLALNGVYFAETLSTGNSNEKDQARKILDQIIASNPNTLDPKRVPETKEEIETAKALRRQLGN